VKGERGKGRRGKGERGRLMSVGKRMRRASVSHAIYEVNRTEKENF